MLARINFSLVALAIVALVLGTSVAQAQVPSLIDYYKLNDTTSGVGAAVLDSAGPNNGTLAVTGTQPVATFGSPGIVGTCLFFPQACDWHTNNNGASVSVSITGGAITSLSNQATWSEWYDWTSPLWTTDDQPRLMQSANNNWTFGFGQPSNAGGNPNRVYGGGGSVSQDYTNTGLSTTNGGVVQSPDVWHLATWTYDGSTINSYIDGALYHSSAASGSIPSVGATLAIGNYPGGQNNGKGYIDDAAILNGALNAAQANAIYQVPHQFQLTGLDTQATGNYGMSDMLSLFTLYANANTSATQAIGGQTWKYVSGGLPGTPGANPAANWVGTTGGQYYVQLDTNGGGIETTGSIPEPGTLALLAAGLAGLLCYAWRKRR